MHRPTDLLAVLTAHREQRGDLDVLRLLGRGEDVTATLTYAGLLARAEALAGGVQAHTAAGDRVLLVCQPGLELVVAFVATLLAGRVPVVLAPHVPKDAARCGAILGNAQPTLVLTDDSGVTTLAARLAPLAPQLPVHACAALAATGAPWRRVDLRPESIAFLQYTSGSTARPKGVVITHGNLLHNLAQIQAKFGTTPDDCALVWLPPYHDMGLIGGILQPLFVGAPVVLMPPLYFVQRPLRWLRAITRFRATITGGPNFALQLCAERITPVERDTLSLESLRLLFVGAERVRPATLATFTQAFAPCGFDPAAFYACYGLAESTLMATGGRAGAGITRHRHAQQDVEHVACGTSIADQELQIVDPATGADCADGQIGEILLASPSVTPGYHGDADASAALFTTRTDALGQARRLLRTGDLGYRHDGALYVTGRCKEVVIVRGRTYQPQDLEECIESADPHVQPHGVACFAFEADATEQLVVYCELRRQRPEHLDLGAVTAAIHAALARTHGLVPAELLFVDERTLPRTTSGKLMRLQLRDAHRRGERPAAITPTKATTEVGA